MALPGKVDPDQVSVHLAGGALSLRVPEAQAVRSQRIEITAG